MAAEGALEFRPPSWYRPCKRWPGKLCLFHDRYCEKLERVLELLHPQPRVDEEEKTAKKKEKEREREMKMREYLGELRREMEAEWRRKQKKKEKKLRRKKKMMTEEEKEEEQKKMMEEEERKRTEEEVRRRMAEEEEEEQWEQWMQWMKTKNQRKPPVEWTIKEGDKYDVPRLLSCPSRDYLIKNNGDKVKTTELSGKHVLLYFWWLTCDGLFKPYETKSNLNADLEEIYRAYNPVGKFHVVFVALGDNKSAFDDSFSRVPWLAIPHEDQEARDLIKKKFAIPYPTSAKAILFAPDGTVLLEDCAAVFRGFGAEGFPFTKKRREVVCCEALELWDKLILKKQKLPLTALLGDYVISSKGNQVRTSLLERKIVGLYFFEVSQEGFERTRELLKIWELAKDMQYKNFEIVFINDTSANLSFAKEKFENEFKSAIPWYSLPFDGRQLCRVFKLYGFQWDDAWNNAGYLIILQPDKYQPLSYFALDILLEFGLDAYPFTLERAVMIEKIKQQEKLVLGELLSPSAPLRRGGSTCFKEDTTVSKLLGKRVLLFFATHSCYESGSFLPALKRMYLEKKGTRDDFEIIYISLDCDESPSSFPTSIQGMPWLVHSYVPDFSVSLVEKMFKLPFHLPAIAAFGLDGHLKTKESNLAFKKQWTSKYPFIEADMDKEVHRELQNRHKWDLDILKVDAP